MGTNQHALEDKELDIVRMREARGMTFQAIADEFGVSRSAVYQAYNRYLEAHPSAAAETLREAHNSELNGMRLTLAAEHNKALESGNLAKVLEIEKTWLKVLERQSKLNGMDLTVSLSFSVDNIEIVPSDYRQRLAPLLPDGMVIDQEGDKDG